MAHATTTTRTGDWRIDALLGAQRWAPDAPGGPLVLTYSFPGTTAAWPLGGGEYGTDSSSEPASGPSGLTTSQQAAVRNALAAWAAIANLSFVEVTDPAPGPGTLRFAWTGLPTDRQSGTYGPGDAMKSGDVWLNRNASWDGFTAGTYGYSTLLHEIGHALGLVHPSESSAPLPAGDESYLKTLMGYTAFAGAPGSWANVEPATPMLYDVLAVQSMYGANTAFRAGDDVYAFAQGAYLLQTIWDAGGVDTIRWDAGAQPATIDLRDGHFSVLGTPVTYWSVDFSRSWTDGRTVGIAYGTTIENATGAGGNDLLIGNDAGNVLAAGGGDDTLAGGSGDDTLAGGAGSDAIDGGDGTDTARIDASRASSTVERTGNRFVVTDRAGGEGIDTLLSIERLEFSDGTYSLANPVHVPGDGRQASFLFDGVFYALKYSASPGALTLDAALQDYLGAGGAIHRSPNAWFDAAYYASRWADLAPLHLDDATLFAHYNLHGVWEGRAGGPKFDRFDGPRYLADYPDVAAYVDAHLADFLGSRTNGAIAHYVIYGANELRIAHDLAGAVVDTGYVV